MSTISDNFFIFIFLSVRSILFARKTNKIHGFFYKFISKGEFLGLKTEVKRTFVLTNRIFWCIMYSTRQNKCSPIRRRRLLLCQLYLLFRPLLKSFFPFCSSSDLFMRKKLLLLKKLSQSALRLDFADI